MSLQTILNRNNISIRQLSIKSGVPYSTLRDLVSGKTSLELASCKTALAIASALYVSVESLFKDDEFSSNNNSLYMNSKKFYSTYLMNRTNVVLKSYSALDYYGFISNYQPEEIEVYSIYKLNKPFKYKLINNFNRINYSLINGILVSTIDQAIDDLLCDKSYSSKQIRSIFENIAFENPHLLGNVTVSKKNLLKFNKYSKGLKNNK